VVDKTQFIKSVGAGISDDGLYCELRFARRNGTQAFVQFAMPDAAEIMLGIETALATAFAAQRDIIKRQDPLKFFPLAPKRVQQIQGGTTHMGAPFFRSFYRQE
jgi:hypothetical protein